MMHAAALTASTMCGGNHSAEFVLDLITQTTIATADCVFTPRTLKITVNEPNVWGNENEYVGIFQAILDDTEKFNEQTICWRFSNIYKKHFAYLGAQFREGKILLRELEGNVPINKEAMDKFITLAFLDFKDFKKVAQELGVSVFLEDEVNTASLESAVKPMLQQLAQEKAIKANIVQLGHTLLALPKNKAGKSGVKALVRAAVVRENPSMWQGKVFDKAWQRLRDKGEIGEFATL